MENDVIVMAGDQKPLVVTPAPAPADAPVQTEIKTTPVQNLETSPAPPAQTPQAWEFKVDELNKKFGTKFKDESEFTSSLKGLDEVPAWKQKADELTQVQNKYEQLLKDYDPRSHFVSDKEYERQLLLKKYPNEDVSVLNKIMSTDLKSAKDLDVLALRELRKVPELNESEARQIALHKLGVDSEEQLNELKESDPTKYRMINLLAKSDASDARKELSAFTKVEVTQNNFEAERQARTEAEQKRVQNLTESTKPLVDEVMNSLKDLKLFKSTEDGRTEEALTYNLDDKVSREIKKATQDEWVRQGWGADKDGFEKARQYAYALNVLSNLPDILSRYEKNIVTREKEATHNLIHNDKPINTTEAPVPEKKQEKWGNINEALRNDRTGPINL